MFKLVTEKYQARHWDGQCLVYNPLTGDTHLFDDFVYHILQQISQHRSGVSKEDLVRSIASGLNCKELEIENMMTQSLLDLKGCYLVEQNG